MKKIISFILTTAIFLSLLSTSLTVFAQSDKETQASNPTADVEDLLYFTCSYNRETEKVTVNGSMNHDAFAAHGESTLVIYAIPPGTSENDIINDNTQAPLAQAAVSIRFGFSFKINKLVDRYSRYAIFLRSEDGKLELTTEPQYPEVISERDREYDKDYFKGLTAQNTAKASDADVGTAVIPVYLDEIFTKNSDGYIYYVEEEQLFFSRAYIDRLDSQINSLSASGARVYLQFLLRYTEDFGLTENAGTEYYMPDVYNENVILKLHSATEFLTDRYVNNDVGNVFGIIVGKGWDNYAKYNFSSAENFERYVQQCALYSVIVANTARSIDPAMDIVLPFTSENFHLDDSKAGEEGKSFALKPLIKALLSCFDASSVHGIDCSFLMETSDVPFGISNESVENGIDRDFLNYNTEIYAGGQKNFTDYCKSLLVEYESAPQTYIFNWTVPKGLNGIALTAAYAYSYYSLMSDDAVSCFIVDIPDSKALSDVFLTMKYIDTSLGLQSTSELLQYFDAKSWNELPGITLESFSVNNSIASVLPSFELPSDIIGSFDYFDFSSSIFTDGWYRGVGCKSIKVDYSDSSKKSLKAELSLLNNGIGQLVYAYPQHENMTHTPYISFDIRVSDSLEDSLYEVEIVLGNSASKLESSCVLKGNEATSIVLDISGYDKANTVENIKISVRSIYGDADTATLWLDGISGHSKDNTSEKLEELIGKDRDAINNSLEEEKTAKTFEKAAIAMGIAIIVGSLAIGLFITFKKNRNEE